MVLTPQASLQALRALSRDARDTLFLLSMILWTVMPHLAQLPTWCMALAGGILAWRARLALVGGKLPGRWVLMGALALGTGLTLMSFGSVFGQQAGVTMLVVLISIKTLELHARRDIFVVLFLGFFLTLTHFLFSQSLLVALAMLVSVWGLLTALVLTHLPVGQPSLRQAGQLAAKTAWLGAPLMVVLFLLFPRIGPLWGVPKDSAYQTGLSDSLRMGGVAELARSDEIVMRLQFIDPPPRPSSLYFRGPVLSQFDGQEWRPLPKPSFAQEHTPQAQLRLQGPSIRYEMTLEPQRLQEVPLLEASLNPPQIQGSQAPALNMTLTEDLRWVSRSVLRERLRLQAQAHIKFEHGPLTTQLGLQDYVELPPNSNPRTLAWAAALRRQPGMAQADAQTLAQAVFRHIQTENFSYTLTPGAYGTQSQHAVDEFWLDRRAGFCEHYASAFVVVMRALDVPARIVTGYQGADPVPVDGYYIVRQNSAHAWAEFWQPGVGWVRADPTAAVSPERINNSTTLAAPISLVPEGLQQAFGSTTQMLIRWRNSWEAVNNRWNQWVLNYSSTQQFDLLNRLGFDSPNLRDLAWMLLAGVGSIAGLSLLVGWWLNHRNNPWARQMQQVRYALRSLGVCLADHDPPLTLAHKTRADLHERAQAEALAKALSALDTLRYGPITSQAAIKRQFRLIRRHTQALLK